MVRSFALFLAVSVFACRNPEPIGPLPSKPDGVFRIAFGSCNKTDLPQPLWGTILASKPDLWVWLGDIIYANTEDPAEMKAMYDAQKSQPGYAAFIAQVPVIGIWDDHDFGENNGGADYPSKKESQQLLLDFLGEPADSPRRKQEGAYAAYRFDRPGVRLKLILLDERYFREDRGPEADILGEAQWSWLEQELAGDSATVSLLLSSTQILPHDRLSDKEKWSDYPKSRARLLKLIASTPHRIVLISGDMHLAELTLLPAADYAGSYDLKEITSSGLTHFRSRIWASLTGADLNRLRMGDYFGGLNFGIADVDEKAREIRFVIVDREGSIRLQTTVSWP